MEKLFNKLFGEKNGKTKIELLKTIKKYAEENTSLFITMLTGMITVIFFLINFVVYCYNVGYFGYFGVNQDVLRTNLQTLNLSNNYFLQILYSVSIGMILVLFNLLGYVFYINGKFIQWYLTVTVAVALYFWVHIFAEAEQKLSLEFVLASVLVSMFFAAIALSFWFVNLGLYYKTIRFLYKGIIINHNKNRANLH